MSTPNPVLATIIFIFALQSIVLSVMLYAKNPKTLSRKFLALLLFQFGLMCVNIALVNVLVSYNKINVFRYIQLELLYGIGPALFFYTKSITDARFEFKKEDFLNFIPVILEFIFYRTSYYRLGADGMYQTPAHPYTRIYLIQQWLGIISITCYTLMALKVLINYRFWLKENYSNIENKSLDWFRVPVLFFSFFWIGWNVLTEIDRVVFEQTLRAYYFLPSFVGLAMVTCWIGFKGYLKAQTEVTGYSNHKTPDRALAKDPQFKSRFAELMEKEKLYLDPNLDLHTLSQKLEMKTKQVSFLINKSFGKNFYELINGFRVEHFMKRITDADAEKYTLLGLAFECGFNSKSTFNHVFKKIVGKTPSQYAKDVVNRSEKKHSVV